MKFTNTVYKISFYHLIMLMAVQSYLLHQLQTTLTCTHTYMCMSKGTRRRITEDLLRATSDNWLIFLTGRRDCPRVIVFNVDRPTIHGEHVPLNGTGEFFNGKIPYVRIRVHFMETKTSQRRNSRTFIYMFLPTHGRITS